MKDLSKTIGVFVRPPHRDSTRLKALNQAKELVLKLLKNDGFESFVIDNLEDKGAIEKAHAFLCLGGDGTMLGALRAVHGYHKPCFGVRMGNLGFLTAIELHELQAFLQALKLKQVKVEKHLALKGGIEKESFYAVNEILITKKEALGVLGIEACVSGVVFNTYMGDGLIIATPLGSTAYNLSASGPIVHALSQSYILTPLCDHSLTQRPLVLGAEFCLSFKVQKEALVVVDGQVIFELKAHQKLWVKASEHSSVLLHKADRDYFKVLKEKLLWGERQETQENSIEGFNAN
ncbi:NAD(+)/NADH kinase [Helicobacter cetorum]|uniref:NAD(+)/NADH kinase n=1 Tax=Helicobacter cetorum TaxID=138563 RepID=UPI000CF0D531|nr:NAD(+)/NADH kinase [Helicobacter cetorum]